MASVRLKNVAKKYSQLPPIGIIEKGQMLPAIEDVVFKLKDGEVSSPLETDTGIFIFKLRGRHPPEQASLEEVKNKIYDMLFQEKFQQKFSDWLKELRNKAYVEIKS